MCWDKRMKKIILIHFMLYLFIDTLTFSMHPTHVVNLKKLLPYSVRPECFLSSKNVSKGKIKNYLYLHPSIHSTTLRFVEHSGRTEEGLSIFNRSFLTCLYKAHKTLTAYFHSIKCLAFSTYFLSRLDEHNYCYNLCNCIDQNTCIQIDSTQFTDKKIKLCIQKMCETSSLKPIVALLKKTGFYCDNNSQFSYELFLLLFTVYKQILLQECGENKQTLKNTSLATIIELGEKINQLPIAEVLTTIDMLMTELPPFLEKYEFNSTISWKKWIKKYWWVPPIVGGWFTLRVLLNFQRSHYYFPSYRPRPSRPAVPTNYPHQTISNDPAWDEICRNETIDKQPTNF